MREADTISEAEFAGKTSDLGSGPFRRTSIGGSLLEKETALGDRAPNNWLPADTKKINCADTPSAANTPPTEPSSGILPSANEDDRTNNNDDAAKTRPW